MFGIANNVKARVRVCTPTLFSLTLDSGQVAQICAEIEDALEKCRRGEITKEEYETLKAELKKQLPIFTFHAMFKHGRRKNEVAIPSGMSIYDLDHSENPRAKCPAAHSDSPNSTSLRGRSPHPRVASLALQAIHLLAIPWNLEPAQTHTGSPHQSADWFAMTSSLFHERRSP